MRELFKNSPVTAALCGSWIVVFVAMLAAQGGLVGNDPIMGGASASTSLKFGAQMAGLVAKGQVWRCLTASFVHYSPVHLLVNLAGLYQIGPILEAWYGGPQFLAVYVFIALVGNLLAAGAKLGLGSWFPATPAFRDLASGGGSVVLVGFIALLAVVGWRSKTRFGDYIRAQMVGLLVFTALLGLLPGIDNFGHAGGGVAGALVGLVHRWLVRRGEQQLGRRFGQLAAISIAVAVFLQGTIGQRTVIGGLEAQRAQLQQDLIRTAFVQAHLREIQVGYHELARRGTDRRPPFALERGVTVGPGGAQLTARLSAALHSLDRLPSGLKEGATGEAYRRMRFLAFQAVERRPSMNQLAQFDREMAVLNEAMRRQAMKTLRAAGQRSGR